MKSLYGSHGIQGMYPWIHVPSEIKGNLIHAQTCVAKLVALNCLSFVSLFNLPAESSETL
jgi:hypothetical protein